MLCFQQGEEAFRPCFRSTEIADERALSSFVLSSNRAKKWFTPIRSNGESATRSLKESIS